MLPTGQEKGTESQVFCLLLQALLLMPSVIHSPLCAWVCCWHTENVITRVSVLGRCKVALMFIPWDRRCSVVQECWHSPSALRETWLPFDFSVAVAMTLHQGCSGLAGGVSRRTATFWSSVECHVIGLPVEMALHHGLVHTGLRQLLWSCLCQGCVQLTA